MLYYIEVPFGSDHTERGVMASEDLMFSEGRCHLRISGRQFERVCKALRERGAPHLITGVGDSDSGGILGTMLSVPAKSDLEPLQGHNPATFAPVGSAAQDRVLQGGLIG